MIVVGPGDVLLTRYDGWTGRWIRFGAALQEFLTGKPGPNLRNHVVIVSHADEAGLWWGIEARADGIGWVKLTGHLRSRWTLTNAAQPKTDAQRAQIVEVARACLGMHYDYPGIFLNALAAVGLNLRWELVEFPERGQQPPHAVCSALADWVYEEVRLANPGGFSVTRLTRPADWDEFITTRAWQ